MISVEAILVLAAVSGAGDTVLLDFSADWCGPCRLMEPTVRRLQTEGYPVRRINIDRDRQLASQYGIRSVPCFVMLADGREVDRVVGATSFDRLAEMFRRARAPRSPPVGGAVPLPGGVRAQSPDRATGDDRFAAVTPRSTSTGGQSARKRAMAASVRLKIEDPDGFSYGSGTIIDVHADEALVVTCGHIFRDSGGKGKITVDLFLPGEHRAVSGLLIAFSLDQDVGLVAIRPGVRVTPVPVAPDGYKSYRDERVFSIGCDRGTQPRLQEGRVTTTTSYVGSVNVVEVAGAPVDGRSGGGLFSDDGFLIGVCNCADPREDRGVYATAATIHRELDRNELSFLYKQDVSEQSTLAATAAAAAPAGAARPSENAAPPLVPDRLPPNAPASFDDRGPLPTNPAGDGRGNPDGRGVAGVLSRREQAVLDAAGDTGGTEVVCILRSRSDPNARSRIVVLDRPSPAFLARLADEFQEQNRRHPTSLQVKGGR